MKILVTGANGFLGQHLCNYLHTRFEVKATARGAKRLDLPVNYFEADITDASALAKAVRNASPEVIIHTAAMSRPDECLANPAACESVNIGGTKNLVEAATALAVKPHIIYISTDFIFGDGGPHDETATPAPLNFYGETKWQAEQLLAGSYDSFTIARPVFMYGAALPAMRPTFLQWVKQSLEEGQEIRLVADQMRTPTYVIDICKGIAAIAAKQPGGVFHLAGEEIMSPYQMGTALAGWCGLDGSFIKPVTASDFPEPVQRAKNGGLLIGKAKRELGFIPISFAKGLERSFPR